MKRIMTIFAVMAIALTAAAQIVQPIKWAGAVEGDSIRLTATIEKGWHLNIIELGNANGIKNGTQDRYFNGALHLGSASYKQPV